MARPPAVSAASASTSNHPSAMPVNGRANPRAAAAGRVTAADASPPVTAVDLRADAVPRVARRLAAPLLTPVVVVAGAAAACGWLCVVTVVPAVPPCVVVSVVVVVEGA